MGPLNRHQGRIRWIANAITVLTVILSLNLNATARAQGPTPPRRNVWAVVIGVESYDSPAIGPAAGARTDAVAVANWLRTSLVVNDGLRGLFHADDRGQATLTDTNQDFVRVKPTYANLTAGLRDWLRKKVRPQDGSPRADAHRDVVLIYFAGHAIGLPADPNSDDLERDYLLPSDAEPDNWSRNGLALDQILEPAPDDPLRDCTVVCWLDTSLRGRGQTPACWPAGAQPDSRLFLTRLVAWPGRSVWLAADGEPSGLTGDGASGLFTEALLRSMGAPGKGPDEGGGLLGALSRLRTDRSLAARGFRSMGAIPRGLALRAADLKPSPPKPDVLVLQRGHARKVGHFALSADDETLITGSDDSSVRLWKRGSREVYRTFADQFDGVQAMALDPSGRYLICGDGVGDVRAYDLERLEPIRVSYQNAPRSTERVEEITFLPGESWRFVTRHALNDRDGRPRGGLALVWTWEKDDAGGTRILAARRLVPDVGNEPARFTRLAATDDSESPIVLVAIDDQGGLRAFDRDLKPSGPSRPLGRAIDVAALAMNRAASRAIVATRSGTLRIIDPSSGDETTVDLGIKLENKGLRVSSGNMALAMGRLGHAVLTSIDHPDARSEFPTRVKEAAWSEDGLFLATTDGAGPPRLWRIGRDRKPQAVAIGAADSEPRDMASSLWIGRGQLIAGDGKGGVRIWALPGADPASSATFEQALKPSRGRVQRVRIDHAGRRLIALTAADNLCWTWDLKADESPRSLPGRARAVEILPDGRGLVVCRLGGAGKGGRIELIDWEGKPLTPGLEPPIGRDVIGFDDVSISPDGRWIAGRCDGNFEKAAQVVLWDLLGAEPGRPVLTIDDHPHLVSSAVFSADSKRLLTIDRGGDARVRDLNDPSVVVGRFELSRMADLDQPVQLTASAFDPGDPTRFVVGTARGEVVACRTASAIQDQPAPEKIGGETRMVTGLAFVKGPAGERWLGASFEDVALKLWKINGARFETETLPFGVWKHEERVNSLVAWPMAEVPMLVSGGDDGTVRFWGLQADGKVSKPLIGTLAVWPRDSSELGEPRDWIAYTPRGAFDGTPGGAQFLRRVGNRVDTVDQQELDQVRYPNLVERFTAGESPAPRGPEPRKPPTLSIAELSRPSRGSAMIRIGYDPEIQNLRLYQNGVPVPMADATRRLIESPDPSGSISVKVRLRQGVNQFYAMASSKQTNTLEGRSDPIELRSTIPESEPRVHLLALGVGDYSRRKLPYATGDARELAEHVRRLVRETQQEPGEVATLLNADVTKENVRSWFRKVRSTVEERPQDKVVVFLAGHTEVIQRTQQFALLPVTYPFQTDWPEVVNNRGPAEAMVPANLEPTVLAFATILVDLVRLQALDRLVVVDACQAESIFSDPIVGRIRRTVDREAWPGRVAYMLATRKGEAALEEKKLEHGLMTYVLLRGTGAPVLNPPEAESVFAQPDSADLDGDRELTIQELQAYVDRKLPALLRRFAGDRERGPGDPPTMRSATEVRPPIVSFPLIRLPGPPTSATP